MHTNTHTFAYLLHNSIIKKPGQIRIHVQYGKQKDNKHHNVVLVSVMYDNI